MTLCKASFKILGKRWTIRVLDKKSYDRKNGSDSLAMTKGYKRLIQLSPLGCDKETIIHELVHAYLHEMCAYSSNLRKDQLEEFFAELMSKRGYELLELSKKLIKKLS